MTAASSDHFVPVDEVRLARMLSSITPEAAHLRPIVQAIPYGVAVLFARPRQVFRAPRAMLGRAAVVIVGDDREVAEGPEAFHLPALRKLLRACAGFAVMSGAPVRDAYVLGPALALAVDRPVVLIETQERREADWWAFARKLAPRAAKLLVTPRPEGNA
jgi:hypothetical protein